MSPHNKYKKIRWRLTASCSEGNPSRWQGTTDAAPHPRTPPSPSRRTLRTRVRDFLSNSFLSFIYLFYITFCAMMRSSTADHDGRACRPGGNNWSVPEMSGVLSLYCSATDSRRGGTVTFSCSTNSYHFMTTDGETVRSCDFTIGRLGYLIFESNETKPGKG